MQVTAACCITERERERGRERGREREREKNIFATKTLKQYKHSCKTTMWQVAREEIYPSKLANHDNDIYNIYPLKKESTVLYV